MIEHNVVVVGGVEHKAVIGSSSKGCSACTLNKYVDKFGDCHTDFVPEDRYDRCNVIFKQHYRPKHNELPIKVIKL